jgi:hypothetical protein
MRIFHLQRRAETRWSVASALPREREKRRDVLMGTRGMRIFHLQRRAETRWSVLQLSYREREKRRDALMGSQLSKTLSFQSVTTRDD